MRRLKRVTIRRIMAWRPCEDWTEARIREVFAGRTWLTPVEILNLPNVAASDKLWVALHPEILSSREMRLFACWCADRALQREASAGRQPDERSLAAIETTRRWLRGEATSEELSEARLAAWSAASAASALSAWSAASASALSALSAASAAALSASRAAALSASLRSVLARSALWSAEEEAEEEAAQLQYLAERLAEPTH